MVDIDTNLLHEKTCFLVHEPGTTESFFTSSLVPCRMRPAEKVTGNVLNPTTEFVVELTVHLSSTLLLASVILFPNWPDPTSGSLLTCM